MNQQQRHSPSELLQKDVDNLLVTVSFSLDEETVHQICSNPDPETAINVMVKWRCAEVKVSTLSAEQKRELVEAEDKELNTFVKYSDLMKMRWVVTFIDGTVGCARFYGPKTWQDPNVFLLRHKGDVKCALLQGDLDEQHADDNDDDNCKTQSAQPVSDTFCETVPELSRKLPWEHDQCVRLLKAVYGLVNAPRRWYHRVATDLRIMRGEESLMELCLRTFRDEHGVIHALCLVYVDNFMLACSDSPFGKHVFDSINNLKEKNLGVTSVHTVRRTNQRSPRQTHQSMGRICPNSLHLSSLNFEP